MSRSITAPVFADDTPGTPWLDQTRKALAAGRLVLLRPDGDADGQRFKPVRTLWPGRLMDVFSVVRPVTSCSAECRWRN